MSGNKVRRIEFTGQPFDKFCPGHVHQFFVKMKNNDALYAEYPMDEPSPVLTGINQRDLTAC